VDIEVEEVIKNIIIEIHNMIRELNMIRIEVEHNIKIEEIEGSLEVEEKVETLEIEEEIERGI